MKIRDYAENKDGKGFHIAPEILDAGEMLERHGEILGIGFTATDAVDKAAEMMTVFLDELDWDEIKRSARVRDHLGDWT